MEENFDREYYIAAACDKFPCDDLDENLYFDAVNKAIDKTLEDYSKNGKLLVEDWDMFDQDLYTNMYNELEKLYD
jgi:hypothetical protein